MSQPVDEKIEMMRVNNTKFYNASWIIQYLFSYTGMFPVGDTSCRTLIDVCVCVCVCVSLSADISLNCAKNDSTDYPEILWVCWV